jgi:hypothetical protein
VPALGENEIEIAVAIEVGHADVRRVLGGGFEIDDGVEGARRGRLLCAKREQGHESDNDICHAQDSSLIGHA